MDFGQSHDDHGNSPAEQDGGQAGERHGDDQARNGAGRYERDPGTVERDAKALALRVQARSYTEIAAELGYADRSGAHKAVSRALQETLEEPAAAVRTLELERLDATLERLNGLEEAAHAVLAAKHVTVSNGKVVQLDGEPLPDDGPMLQALDRLLRVEEMRLRVAERRAKLLGLDAEKKVALSGGVKYEVVGVDVADLA
ncbi:hypothetical protein [Actinomadura macrotermitis]|uniref:Terminase small subunit n=1 Tax=Actinomadura macrotermitis TaxID=2585200 RepID=A0A7K0BSH7_9ACTN|nr:hypothetical protein [Actinomadura macrotermitis]MQY04129.1 hypothetical protein [Actinomadura macrotermitis]